MCDEVGCVHRRHSTKFVSVMHLSKFFFFFLIVAMAEIAELVEVVRRLVKTGQETSQKLARSGRKENYAFNRKANNITKQAHKMPHLKSVLCMCIPRQCYKMI